MRTRHAARRLAGTLLKTVALPLGWWDDVLGNRFKILGWARSTLNCVADDLEQRPCSRRRPAAHETVSADERQEGAVQPEADTGDQAPVAATEGAKVGAEPVQEKAPEPEPEPVEEPEPVPEPVEEAPEPEPEPEVAEEAPEPEPEPEVAEEAPEPEPEPEVAEEAPEPVEARGADADVDVTPGPPDVPVISSPPIAGYDVMNVRQVQKALRQADHALVSGILEYEKAHKNRKTVRDACEKLLDESQTTLPM